MSKIKINTFTYMKEKKKLKYNAWNEHLNNTRERTNYSIRRMDLLIISICGAGLYIIFETLREFKTGNIDIETPKLLMWSGIFLLVAITANFISQLTGYHANNNEEKFAILELDKIEGKKIEDCEQGRLDKLIERLNLWTDILNAVSMILMFIGLILLAIFNYYLF